MVEPVSSKVQVDILFMFIKASVGLPHNPGGICFDDLDVTGSCIYLPTSDPFSQTSTSLNVFRRHECWRDIL